MNTVKHSEERLMKVLLAPVISEKATLESMLKWNKPDEEGLKAFLVGEKGFTEQKVDSGLKKLAGAQTKVN